MSKNKFKPDSKFYAEPDTGDEARSSKPTAGLACRNRVERVCGNATGATGKMPNRWCAEPELAKQGRRTVGQVSACTPCRRADFVRPRSKKKDNLILIGFMGCGKSSVGKALAKKLDKIYLDTDALIEAKEGQKIKQIFKTKGERAFRKMEKSLLKSLKASIKGAIIASGGGFGVQKGLKKLGKVVFLRAEFNDIKARLSQKELKKRPLFQDEKRALELFNQRQAKYSKKADIIINTKDKDIKQIVKEIRSKI